ncbi:protein FAM185A isoform X3 [Dasypus novemcinctus]|uniref:protein FAM185A isoform X3 n=1 Tax=Dasypus novemcinctus TaxID=9361 RepID=UPI00265EE3C1|nr:protein FAM185A isoform X2 [Dasypus novemcinctus]
MGALRPRVSFALGVGRRGRWARGVSDSAGAALRLAWVRAPARIGTRSQAAWFRAQDAEGMDAAGEPIRPAADTASMPPGREASGPTHLPRRRPRVSRAERSRGRYAGPRQPADLYIKSSGSGCVKIKKFECDNCEIETEQGTSILQSVKSQKVRVQTKGGKVICLGTVHGNIDIHASDESTVTIDKLQGSSVNISTEDGLLKVKYLYTESSFLSSAAGDITLGSVHGDTMLQSQLGNIIIDSFSGSLKASTQGAIDVYVSQLGEVDLSSHKGSVIVKVPSSLQAHLQLSGKEIDVNSEIHIQEMAETHKEDCITITGLMNQTGKYGKRIKADAPKGTVSFRSQSWFQSLKLQD